jgi:hypothetical protein
VLEPGDQEKLAAVVPLANAAAAVDTQQQAAASDLHTGVQFVMDDVVVDRGALLSHLWPLLRRGAGVAISQSVTP